MKKLFFYSLFFVSVTVCGQIRHVKGIKAFDLSYGASRYGKTFGMGFVKYFSTNLYGKIDMYFEKGQAPGLAYNSNGVNCQAAYKVFKYKGLIYVNAVGGVSASYDSPEKGGNFTINTQLKYGVFAGTEIEFFISDKLAVVTNWNQRYLLGNLYGQTRWYSSVGLRFNF
jgi:hypothetical protein